MYLNDVKTLVGSNWKLVYVALILMIVASIVSAVNIGLLLPLFEIISDDSTVILEKYTFVIWLHDYVDPAHVNYVLVAAFIAIVLVRITVSIVSVATNNYLAHKLWVGWADKVGTAIISDSYVNILSEKAGKHVHNYLREPFQATKGVLSLLSIMTDLTMILFVYSVMLFVNFQVTLFFSLFLASLFFIVSRRVVRYSKNVGKKRQKLTQSVTAQMTETIGMLKIAKIFSIEEQLHDKSIDILEKIKKINVKFAVIQFIPVGLSDLVILLFISGFVLFEINVIGLSISQVVPELIFFAASMQKLYSSASRAFSMRMVFESSLPSFELISNFMTGTDVKQELITIKNAKDDIVLNNVSFSYYPGCKVLDDISINIPAGEVTVFWGQSGSGKSTLIDILLKLIDQDSGSVYVGGVSLTDYDDASWRNCIGYVNQDVMLFNDTIKNNILIGNGGGADDDVYQAAKIAGIHDYIISLKDGYNTFVGDRGESLSGGQKQRITIARALVRNPDILILDEALSALDVETSSAIMSSIMSILPRKTIIIVSHNPEVLNYSSNVYYLTNGMVTQKV